jgi:hypothetical protein
MKISALKLKTPSDDVAALIENGMNFLDKARVEFEAKEYKHSVVNFWTAVEILLKVPLASEHWTLVCSGKKVSRKAYLAGDFQSVSFDEVCTRLREILERPLPKDTETIFNTIRNHRNRVVHFYHPAFSDSEVATILGEQARAWFALNRLMREDWQQHYAASLNWKLALSETRLLQGNTFYAEARLKHIYPELEQLLASGVVINPCPVCHQPAAIEKTIATGDRGSSVCERACRVCFDTERYVKLDCPECNHAQVMPVEEEENEMFSCSHCPAELTRYDVLNEEVFRSVDEMMYAIGPANCSSCDGHETVCVYGGRFLCTRCLEPHSGFEKCAVCSAELDTMGYTGMFLRCESCSAQDSEDSY